MVLIHFRVLRCFFVCLSRVPVFFDFCLASCKSNINTIHIVAVAREALGRACRRSGRCVVEMVNCWRRGGAQRDKKRTSPIVLLFLAEGIANGVRILTHRLAQSCSHEVERFRIHLRKKNRNDRTRANCARPGQEKPSAFGGKPRHGHTAQIDSTVRVGRDRHAQNKELFSSIQLLKT